MLGISPQMLWARAVMANDMIGPDAPARVFYQMLEGYYLNNGLYDST